MIITEVIERKTITNLSYKNYVEEITISMKINNQNCT